MTQEQANALKSGDKVYGGITCAGEVATCKGVVDYVTTEGNYIRIIWAARGRGDILARTSPLLRLLEIEQ